jgi:ribosomal protein L12E/L44/L45/RPP1/RPP2
MTLEELNEAIDELRAQGESDEDIAAGFYLMFSEKKIDFPQFEALLEAIGYEVDDEFRSWDEETQRTFALNDDYKEGENDKESPQNVPDKNGEDKVEDSNNEKEDEEKNAMRLFGK